LLLCPLSSPASFLTARATIRLVSVADRFTDMSTPPVSEISMPAVVVATDRESSGKSTHAQILTSTAVIGGSSVVTIVFGIIRTKAMAVLLGPAGVGLMGLYTSIVDVAQSLAGMGIQSSGVRQIAEAVGSGDEVRVARTATVLRRVALFFGSLGALLLVVFAERISRFTFETSLYTRSIMVLSIAVLFKEISVGQGALIQGLRRISDLAKMSVIAAVFGTVIAIPFVYALGEDGIVASLVAVAGVSIASSWWYSRKTHIRPPSMSASDIFYEASGLLKLGFAFMASAFLTMGSAYAIRIIVLRLVGVEAAGLYAAAWGLGGLYVGIILQAMGADFYPRLTGVATDNAECNRLVNEQAQVSLLLAGPGVIGTLACAPLILSLFYSSAFWPAVNLLRWICLGMTLRVIAFPMGYIILAKGAQRLFILSEVAATVVHVGLAWVFVHRFGLDGAGAAFFGLYAWHACFIYAVVRRVSGFRWSTVNRQTGAVFLLLTGCVFVSFYLVPTRAATAIGGVVALLSGLYSLHTLRQLVPVHAMPRTVRPLLVWLRW
jgi:antigen flippase